MPFWLRRFSVFSKSTPSPFSWIRAARSLAPAAAKDFQIAADYWQSVLTSNITVRLDVGYSPLAAGVIGSTSSTKYGVSTADVYGALAATGNRALDAIAVANLTPLTAAGGLQMITSGYKNSTAKAGVNVTKHVFDTDNSANNLTMGVNSAT